MLATHYLWDTASACDDSRSCLIAHSKNTSEQNAVLQTMVSSIPRVLGLRSRVVDPYVCVVFWALILLGPGYPCPPSSRSAGRWSSWGPGSGLCLGQASFRLRSKGDMQKGLQASMGLSKNRGSLFGGSYNKDYIVFRGI